MEDVLDLYEEPYDPKQPVICLDERPCQLLGEVFTPVPVKPGRKRREDYEYVRAGHCALFMLFEPQQQFRHVEVRPRRTARDYADMLKLLADEIYPEAIKIRVVQDNLNTHTPAALYQRFEPAEARRLTQRFEFHYTPIHASWLNMAEIELSVISRQCLHRRIDSIEKLASEAQAWAQDRNARKQGVTWCFTTKEARRKLERFYENN
jgi:hypothetical protein